MNFLRAPLLLLLIGLTCSSCQSNGTDATISADLNSSNPAVAAQAQKVRELEGQLQRQQAVIEAEKARLEAMQQQLKGAKENLEGLKKEAQATP